MELYICPTCKAESNEHEKYCHRCGTWLINATKKTKSNKTKRKGWMLSLIVIGLIIFFVSNNSPTTLTFNDMTVSDKFTISQLKVDPSKPTAAADLTVHQEVQDPVEVVAVFYDDESNRVGKASALITNAMPANHTTTLDFKFTEAVNLNKTKNVRVEINQLSPFQLLEKAANMMK